jgi:hypothetical protein
MCSRAVGDNGAVVLGHGKSIFAPMALLGLPSRVSPCAMCPVQGAMGSQPLDG